MFLVIADVALFVPFPALFVSNYSFHGILCNYIETVYPFTSALLGHKTNIAIQAK